MRKTTTIPALIGYWLSGIFLALVMGLVTMPAVAVLSDKTGQIQGQTPTVTGSLQVLFPDGETVLVDNAILELNQIPNQFRVSPSTVGLVLQDADGDSGLSALVDTEQARLIWKHDGAELTPEQLAAPLGDNFSGQTLTLEVSASVTVSSVTGLPTTAEPRILTGSYTLKVAAVFTGVSVNGYNFAIDAGFPSTGFIGAEFSLTVTGAANDYTWTSSASWVSVDSSGEVQFVSEGDSTPVTITATPRAGGAPLTYTFTLNNWFINNGLTTMNWSDAANWCSTQGVSLATTWRELSQGTRAVGSLWSEWGGMVNYVGSGFSSNYYWTSEANGSSYHDHVNLGDGRVGSLNSSSVSYVVCRQGL